MFNLSSLTVQVDTGSCYHVLELSTGGSFRETTNHINLSTAGPTNEGNLILLTCIASPYKKCFLFTTPSPLPHTHSYFEALGLSSGNLPPLKNSWNVPIRVCVLLPQNFLFSLTMFHHPPCIQKEWCASLKY